MRLPIETGYFSTGLFVAAPENPRKPLPTDPHCIKLGESMKRTSQIHPIACRPHPDPDQPGMYEIRAGHCRLAGAVAAGIDIRAEVFDWNDDEAFMVTLEENAKRKDLSPLEEVKICAACLDRFDAETTAAKLGVSESWVRRRAALLDLTDSWQEKLSDPAGPFSSWTVGHLEVIAKLPKGRQDAWLKQVLQDDPENVTIKSLRQAVAKGVRLLNAVPWDMNAGKNPCSSCDKRSSCQPLLPNLIESDEQAPPDECLDSKCFLNKLKRHLVKGITAAVKKHEKLKITIDIPYGFGDISYDLRQAYEDRTVQKWNWDSCKKSADGATPHAVVNPDGVGDVKWIKKKNNSSGSAPKQDGPKSLKERMEGLKRRRQAKAVKALQADLVDAVGDVWLGVCKLSASGPWEGILGYVCNMAAAFGTDFKHEYRASYQASVDPWKIVKGGEDSARIVFDSVLKVLAKRLEYYTVGDVDDTEAKKICKLLGLDFKLYMKAATAAIREPKSWAAEKLKLKQDKSSDSEIDEARALHEKHPDKFPGVSDALTHVANERRKRAAAPRKREEK